MQPRNVYLISYPRSGNSLTRTYFSCLTGRPQRSIYAGDVVFPRDMPLTTALDGVELIKSHHYDQGYTECVYIVRDGRNAMISHLYLQFLHQGHSFSRPEDLLAGLRFLTEQRHFWGSHVQEALDRALVSRVHFVKYEDLLREPLRVLRSIARFLGVQLEDAVLTQCIALVRNSTVYKDNYYSGYTYTPEEGSLYALLKRHRDGEYWQHIFDLQSRRYFHERGGTALLRKFGYAQFDDWWLHEPLLRRAPDLP